MATGTDPASVSILPSISTNGDLNTLFLSFLLSSLFLVLLSYHMVTATQPRPPTRLLIPISPVQVFKIKDQRGSHRPVLCRHRCIVRPFHPPPPLSFTIWLGRRPVFNPSTASRMQRGTSTNTNALRTPSTRTTTKVEEVLRRGRPRVGQILPRLPSDWTRYTTLTRVRPRCSRLSRTFSCRPFSTDHDGGEIEVDGALTWCKDLGVDPEDVVLLPIAYELKSPSVGSFPRKPWIDGWRSLGCDSIPSMRTALPKLRDKLANDPSYFTAVYNYTFEFAKTGAQRSISVETAIAFWGLLIPHGLTGAALAHTSNDDEDDGGDTLMGTEEGWRSDFTSWWFEFLTTKGGKGVSKDTWTMVGSIPFVGFIFSHHGDTSLRSQFLHFVRTVDPEFENHDYEC